MDAVGQAGAVDQYVSQFVVGVVVNKPLQVIEKENLLSTGISEILQKFRDLRAGKMCSGKQSVGDAALEPLAGITIAQSADQIETDHRLERVEPIFVGGFQNRIQTELLHEAIEQIDVPEDKRDELSGHLQSGFALGWINIGRGRKKASGFGIILKQSSGPTVEDESIFVDDSTQGFTIRFDNFLPDTRNGAERAVSVSALRLKADRHD